LQVFSDDDNLVFAKKFVNRKPINMPNKIVAIEKIDVLMAFTPYSI
jgi:hypothetical protein